MWHCCKYHAILAPPNLHSFLVALSRRRDEHIGKRRRTEFVLMVNIRDFLFVMFEPKTSVGIGRIIIENNIKRFQ